MHSKVDYIDCIMRFSTATKSTQNLRCPNEYIEPFRKIADQDSPKFKIIEVKAQVSEYGEKVLRGR